MRSLKLVAAAETGPSSTDGIRRRRIREAQARFDREAPLTVQAAARGWGKIEAVLAVCVVLAILFVSRLVQPGRVCSFTAGDPFCKLFA